MEEKKTVLEARDLHKSFAGGPERGELKVLQGMNLSIAEGSITSIIGSSGSGKSTLLHILGGLDRADSGDVLWDSNNISSYKADDLADYRNKYIGFVFQFHHLLPEFTALENVAMPALIGGTSSDQAYSRAEELLGLFGVEERKSHRPTQLSGGEQQRVSMARALMNNPRIILADEPTGNLDQTNTNIILDLLFELREAMGVSVLLITHEKEIAGRSDTILELKNGILETL
ncbi:MAG: lipoprotein-releasing system ATP-binding protein LolD [Balneola sp.]|jgi:lipoprotein-releasing system ATP-binding protein|nr:lipoprotein-releasing system ATP-binding protein LolD [Balneola sp.]MBE79805.1 lipoprotein-releasing system ATP-binding protein LolD [Balneola sp.]|tara:strand:+ start:32758 stop:33450 length:693 start_codon:yes stop_codon:yes gene_type:complete